MSEETRIHQAQRRPASPSRQSADPDLFRITAQGHDPWFARELHMHNRVQAKLTVNAPDDAFEKEADAAAESVIQGKSASIGSGSAGISRSGGAGGFDVNDKFAAELRGRLGGGQGLNRENRSAMEQSYGADLGSVRVHTDNAADRLSRSINARAFTHGNDIFFRQGEYNPATSQGQRLLAHETAHTVQQSGGLSRMPILIQREPKRRVQFNLSRDIPAGDPEEIALRETIRYAYLTETPDDVEYLSAPWYWDGDFEARKKGDAFSGNIPAAQYISGLRYIYRNSSNAQRVLDTYEASAIDNTGLAKLDKLCSLVANLNPSELDLFLRKQGGIPTQDINKLNNLEDLEEFIEDIDDAIFDSKNVEDVLKAEDEEREANFIELRDSLFAWGMTIEDFKAIEEGTNRDALLKKYEIPSFAIFEEQRDAYVRAFKMRLVGETFRMMDRNEALVNQEIQHYKDKPDDLTELAQALFYGAISREFDTASKIRTQGLKRFWKDFNIQSTDFLMHPMGMIHAEISKGIMGNLTVGLNMLYTDVLVRIHNYLNDFWTAKVTAGVAGAEGKQDRFVAGIEKYRSSHPDLVSRALAAFQPYKGIGARVLPPELNREIIGTLYPEFQEAFDMERMAPINTAWLKEKHPFLNDITENWRDLSYKHRFAPPNIVDGLGELKKAIPQKLHDKLGNIATVRGDIRDDPNEAWRFEILIQKLKRDYGIPDDGVTGFLVDREVEKYHTAKRNQALLLGAIGIVIGIIGALTLNPVIIAAGIGISAADLYLEYSNYSLGKAALNTGFEEQLSAVDPPFWPVVLAAVGLALDVVDAFAKVVKVLKGIARGTPGLKRALRPLYDELTADQATGKALREMGFKKFSKMMIEAYENGFDEIKNVAGFPEFLKAHKAVLEGLPKYVQPGLAKVFTRNPAMAEAMVKGVAASPSSLNRLSLELIVNPGRMDSFESLFKLLGEDSGEVFRYLGAVGKDNLQHLDAAIKFLPDGMAKTEARKLLLDGDYYTKAATGLRKVSEAAVTEATDRIVKGVLTKVAGHLTGDADVLTAIRRLLAQGLSESDIEAVLLKAGSRAPEHGEYGIKSLLRGLDVLATGSNTHLSPLMQLLKGSGEEFDKAFRTISYTFDKGKWAEFEQLYRGRVLGNVDAANKAILDAEEAAFKSSVGKWLPGRFPDAPALQKFLTAGADELEIRKMLFQLPEDKAGKLLSDLFDSLTGGLADVRKVMQKAEGAGIPATELGRVVDRGTSKGVDWAGYERFFDKCTPIVPTEHSWKDIMDFADKYDHHWISPGLPFHAPPADKLVIIKTYTATDGTVFNVTEYNIKHYLKGHTWEHFKFNSPNINRAPSSTILPEGTPRSFFEQMAEEAIKRPDVEAHFASSTNHLDVILSDGRTWRMRLNPVPGSPNVKSLDQFYPRPGSPNVTGIRKEALHGIKAINKF